MRHRASVALGVIALVTACKTINQDASRLLAEEAATGGERPMIAHIDLRSGMLQKIRETLISNQKRTSSGYEYEHATARVGAFLDPSRVNGIPGNSVAIPIDLDVRGGGAGSGSAAFTTAGAKVDVWGTARAVLYFTGGGANSPGKIGHTAPTWAQPPQYRVQAWADGLFAGRGRAQAESQGHQQGAAGVQKMRQVVPSTFNKEMSAYIDKFQGDYAKWTTAINSIPGLTHLSIASNAWGARFAIFPKKHLDSAITPAPDIPQDRVASFNLHEQALIQVGRAELAGRTVPVEKLRSTLCESFKEELMRICADEEQEKVVSYDLIFDEDPIDVKFNDDLLRFALRLKMRAKLCEEDGCESPSVTSPLTNVYVTYKKDVRSFVDPEILVQISEESDVLARLGGWLNARIPASLLPGTASAEKMVEKEIERVIRGSLAESIVLPTLPALVDQGTLVAANPNSDVKAENGWLIAWYSHCPARNSKSPLGVLIEDAVASDDPKYEMLRVSSVLSGYPAASATYVGEYKESASGSDPGAGLKKNDYIFAVNGERLTIGSRELFSTQMKTLSMVPRKREVTLSVARKIGSEWRYMNYKVALQPACNL